MDKEEIIFHWYGKPSNELSRQELLDVIVKQQKQVEAMREDFRKSLEFLTKR